MTLLASHAIDTRTQKSAWWETIDIWIRDPQYLNRSILRCEIVSDSCGDIAFNAWASSICSNTERIIERKLIPKIHREANTMLQRITVSRSEDSVDVLHELQLITPDGIVEICVDPTASQLPFYHPKVTIYSLQVDFAQSILKINGDMCRDGDEQSIVQAKSTMQHVLDKFGKFVQNRNKDGKYEKRVLHDQLVKKAKFQDRYRMYRRTHNHWVGKWDIDTDPQKHVFEEIAIATFLICMWEDMYGADARDKVQFVDFGCGNGFLTHLLTSEGFLGYGVDIQKRKIWDAYGSETGERLICETCYPQQMIFDVRSGRVVKENQELPNDNSVQVCRELWIVGNHPDELTAWVPVVAAKTNHHAAQNGYEGISSTPCKFMILPCCFHDFDGGKHDTTLFALDQEFLFQPPVIMPSLGGGRYSLYVQYICQIANFCGFKAESEFLRIPSTKNLAIVGRATWPDSRSQKDLSIAKHWCESAEMSNRITGHVVFMPRMSDQEKTLARFARAQNSKNCNKVGAISEDWEQLDIFEGLCLD